jgi:ribosomal protein S27AE
MTRQFCDRCGADVTQKLSASVRVIGDADSQGNGAVTSDADLCQRCRRALETWLTTHAAPPPKKTRP